MRTATTRYILRLLAVAAVAAVIPAVLAHGDEEEGAGMEMDMDGDMDMPPAGQPEAMPQGYETYFAHKGHAVEMYVHIALMTLSWVFVLPVAVMFSIARSRYTLALQFLFLVCNALGVFLGITYNANTPDLYPNNAHHKLGWVVTWFTAAQALIGLAGRAAGMFTRDKDAAQGYAKEETESFIPVSAQAMAEHHRMDDTAFARNYRNSDDSVHGNERNFESTRSNSVSTMVGQESPTEDRRVHFDDLEDLDLKPAAMQSSDSPNTIVARIAGKVPSWGWKVLLLAYNVIDRTILILGFVAMCTGVVTYARFFEGHEIFSGLAHWIKGAIFFWYGLLTLGRWSGSFGELGWAWNVRPKQSSKKWRPTAEFVEGFLIFFYGSTNIFLEHLGNAGEPISGKDLEHMSITVLFIGGGALSMLIESTRIRDLLNTTVTDATLSHSERTYADEERDTLEDPDTYEFSVNPIPALVILLLGIMMSSHTQAEMISAMVHKQWGNLLTAASFARGFTYVLLYLKPPKSILPSRPPTELLTAFGLISGGLIFMSSAEDTIRGMINYELDAMFMYTVVMGMVGLLMAWVIVVLALKGWIVRRESARSQRAWSLTSRV